MKKTKKILGLCILGFVMVGFAYLWITDIQPDIDTVSKIHEEIRAENERIEQERISSYQNPTPHSDCYYDESQKVTVCD